jgi:hypothetical protein
MATDPTLSRRIADLHKELEKAIANYVAEMARYYPGIPRDVIRHCEVGSRAGGCLCKAYDILAAREPPRKK